MIKNLFLKTVLCISLFLMVYTPADSCTSAIFTSKVNKDGKPVMWKHRDTGEENNRIEYFKGPKYSFYALVNSPLVTKGGKRSFEAWSGSNDAGFCIMNTASYNLKNDNIPDSKMDNEGTLMFKALGRCKNLADFEKLLDTLKRPMGVETNFGVIDSEGGAAYYEVNNTSWIKIDVNDPKIAPQGYLVYTNHSYTGRKDEGMGYIRYTTADNIIKKRIARRQSYLESQKKKAEAQKEKKKAAYDAMTPGAKKLDKSRLKISSIQDVSGDISHDNIGLQKWKNVQNARRMQQIQ